MGALRLPLTPCYIDNILSTCKVGSNLENTKLSLPPFSQDHNTPTQSLGDLCWYPLGNTQLVQVVHKPPGRIFWTNYMSWALTAQILLFLPTILQQKEVALLGKMAHSRTVQGKHKKQKVVDMSKGHDSTWKSSQWPRLIGGKNSVVLGYNPKYKVNIQNPYWFILI